MEAAQELFGERLPRDRYVGSSEAMARALLGRVLVRRMDDGELLAARIVETEAYIGARDRASHAYRGRRTARNESMYGPPGTAYVYFTYGMHHCVNVVCGALDVPVAVLLRGAEPLAGVERMMLLRGGGGRIRAKALEAARLCAGPGRLCQALAIDRNLDGVDLVTDDRLWIADGRPEHAVPDRQVTRAARVGLGFTGPWAERRLRWLVKGSAGVSVGVRKPGSGRKGTRE